MRDPVTMMERAWLLKTGRPPRPFESYSLVELRAMLLHPKEAEAEITRMARSSEVEDDDWLRQEENKLKKTHPWDEPMFDGDPLGDKWEAAIARGEIPDFDEEL